MKLNSSKYIGLCACVLVITISIRVFASNTNQQEDALMNYCYGMYQSIADPKEVQKHNALLERLGKTYTKIKKTDAYKKGVANAKNASKEKKKHCKEMVYGFLAIAQMKSGYKDNKKLDPAYCLGYVTGVVESTDSGLQKMVMKYCTDTFTSQTEKNACFKDFYTILKTNVQFNKGRAESKDVVPIRLLNCFNHIKTLSEEIIKSAFIPEQQELNIKKTHTGKEYVKPLFN